MTEPNSLPTADAVIIPAVAKLVELRPNAFQYVNLGNGVYWHPVLGFRAQAARILQQTAKRIAAKHLDTAKKQELRDYVASEFGAVPDVAATRALGTLTLGRFAPTAALPAGDYPKGTRFTRSYFVQNGVTFQQAEFESISDVHVSAGSTAPVTIPVQAVATGSGGNTPVLLGNTTFHVGLPSLVGNMTVVSFESGGGSDGPDDDFVRLYARAHALGEYGPTSSAGRLGALSAAGVRHALTYDIVPTGTQAIVIADQSWGGSSLWAGAVQQSMFDADTVGFGCKIAVSRVRNQLIQVVASIRLRDANYLLNTTDVANAVQAAVRSYFDDRADWNTWNLSALKSVIARSHPKVFSCSSVTVNDYVLGTAMSEIVTPNFNVEQFHYLLPNNAMQITFQGPA